MSGKILLIDNLLSKSDKRTVGGVTIFAFDKVLGWTDISSSLFDGEGPEFIRDMIQATNENRVKTNSLEKDSNEQSWIMKFIPSLYLEYSTLVATIISSHISKKWWQ